MRNMKGSGNKKLGIIGGQGSWATAYFFTQIVEKTVASHDQEYIDTIVLNHATLPDRTKAIVENDTELLLSLYRQDTKILEDLGVNTIAIPCNTSHYFYDQIQSYTTVPIIHMPRETIAFIMKKYPATQAIGVLATDGTVRAKVYENEITKQGVRTILPSAKSQRAIMKIIYDEIKSGKKGSLDTFMELAGELRNAGADTIILGCTELSYFRVHNDIPHYCIDALDVLVHRSIELSGKQYKE